MTSSCTTGDVIPGLESLLQSPIPATVRKLLEAAQQHGWEHNFTSMVTRWYPNGEAKYGLPWFAAWHLNHSPDKAKWSWRFAGSRASNGQQLNLNDAMLYVEHPEVIYPEPPARTQAEKLRETYGNRDR